MSVKFLKEAVQTENTYKEDAPIRAWIGNLGKYNEGELVGAWIDFPIDEDELQQKLHDDVLIGTEDEFGQPYEEYGIFDWESDYVDYPGEYESLKNVNEWAQFIDGLSSYDLDVLKMAKEAGYIDDILDFDADDYIGFFGVDDDRSLGEYWIEQVYGGIEALSRDTLEEYFDYAMLGRDLSFDSFEDDYGNDISAGEFFCGDENATDYEIGEEYVTEVGFEGVGNIENYFDYEAFGESVASDGMYVTDGFIIDNR